MRFPKYFLIILVLLSILISGCIPDCGTDLECFKEKAKDCSKSKVNILDGEGNNIRVTVRGFDKDSCRVSFKIESIGEKLKTKYPTETRIAVGKTLNCKISKKYAEYETLDYVEEIFNLPEEFDRSCSGPIKDLLEGPLKPIIVNEFQKILIKEGLSH